MTGKQVRQVRREGNLAYVTLTKGYEAYATASAAMHGEFGRTT